MSASFHSNRYPRRATATDPTATGEVIAAHLCALALLAATLTGLAILSVHITRLIGG